MSATLRWMAAAAMAVVMPASLFGAPVANQTPPPPEAQAALPAPGSLDRYQFRMVRSANAVQANCLPNAWGNVTIEKTAQNDLLTLDVTNMPPNTEFALFVTQLPNIPFGVSWYQADLKTDAYGKGRAQARGIFNIETFSLSLDGPANGANPTQNVTGKAIVNTDVTFRPTKQYHLGLWFDNAQDAAKAGCQSAVTPFNGEQQAGVQALSTRNFPANQGPLAAIKP